MYMYMLGSGAGHNFCIFALELLGFVAKATPSFGGGGAGAMESIVPDKRSIRAVVRIRPKKPQRRVPEEISKSSYASNALLHLANCL